MRGKKIAITGGSGFIGGALVKEFLAAGQDIVSFQRVVNNSNIEVRIFDLGCIDSMPPGIFSDIDVVIHTAALVHSKAAQEEEHIFLNFEATRSLFERCEIDGVGRFIFISSVAVYGVSSSREVLNIKTPIAPISSYAKSKLRCEEYLLSRTSDIKITILRLPLVYGEGAPGNYGALEKIAHSKLPLPFLNLKNRRSMIGADKVAKLIFKILVNKNEYLGLHLVAEKKPFSTEQIVRNLRAHHGISPMLFQCPLLIIRLILNVLGKKKLYEQLFENLEFSSSIEVE